GCLDQPGKGESAPRDVEAEAVEHDETGPVGVELEHSAVVADTTLVGCAVERDVGPLHQASIGLATLAQVDSGRKALEHSEFAPVRVQLEDCAAVDTATEESRTVERSVGSLHQRGMRVRPVCCVVEVLEQGKSGPVGVELEDRASIAADTATATGRAVTRAVRALHQVGLYIRASR